MPIKLWNKELKKIEMVYGYIPKGGFDVGALIYDGYDWKIVPLHYFEPYKGQDTNH